MASLLPLNQSPCLQHSSRMAFNLNSSSTIMSFKQDKCATTNMWNCTDGLSETRLSVQSCRNENDLVGASKLSLPSSQNSKHHPRVKFNPSTETIREFDMPATYQLTNTDLTYNFRTKRADHSHNAFLGWSRQSNMSSSKQNSLLYGNTSSKIFSAMNMNASQPEEHGKSNIDLVIDKARKLWDSSPQEVKSFPWTTTVENFTQLIIDIVLVVTQYLYVPVMAITSVSEMSYCAHERKLVLIPLPILIGVAVAGVLRNRALKLSPYLKDAKVPWHLYANMLFFTLIKLPGPYYPYWGRIFIPHFANGGLFRTLWFLFQWYRMPRKDVQTDLGGSNI